MTKYNNDVMAGLVPAIHVSDEAIVKVIPIGICREDQAHLPGPRPMLHVTFPLNCNANVCVAFCEHQPLQSVSLGESVSHTLSVFPYATRKIIGDAGVERAVRPVGYDINPSAFHRETLIKWRTGGNGFVDGRHKAAQGRP